MNNQKGKFKSIYKKIKNGFNRYINGTKGVISLFLAILMVPFVTLAGALVNAARVNSAIAIFDEALCNASNSTLGTYDDFLRKRFGLMAVSQGEYTSDDFLKETFEEFINQNINALSNTYSNLDFTVDGVMPLADTDILNSQVLEYGKAIMPIKLAMEGLSIAELTSLITKAFNPAGQLMSLFSGGVSVGDAMNDCHTAFNDLLDAIKASDKAEDKYTDSYNDFKKSVTKYNALVDELEAQKEVVTARELAKQQCETAMHKAEGEKAKKAAQEAYSSACDALDAAQNKLSSIESDIASQIAKVGEKKNDYSEKILQLATALGETLKKIENAQNTYSQLNQTTTQFASEMGSALADETIGKLIEDNNEGSFNSSNELIAERDRLNKLLEDEPDNEKRNQINDDIKKVTDALAIVEKQNNTAKAAQGLYKLSEFQQEKFLEAATNINAFCNDECKKLYNELYNNLIENLNILEAKVQIYDVNPGAGKLSEITSEYYYALSTLLKESDVLLMLTQLADEVAETGFIELLKSLAAVITALLEIDGTYSSDLVNTVNLDNYSSIKGLPSYKDSNRFTNDFDAADAEKSNKYKILLGCYSTNPEIVAASHKALGYDDLSADMKEMKNVDLKTNNSKNIFAVMAKIYNTIKKIFESIVTLVKTILNAMANILTTIGHKLLLAGYITYNVPNRTTYTGSSITGAQYSLPAKDTEYSTYAFAGAELEYIFNGSLEEKDNQKDVFWKLFVMRIIFSVPPAFIDGEFKVIFAAIPTPFNFVIAILYVLVDALLDTLILVNSGEVAAVKLGFYLTPGGIDDLITNILGTGLSKAQKEKITKAITNNASDKMLGGDGTDSEKANTFKAKKDELTKQLLTGDIEKVDNKYAKKLNNKYVNAINFDYTESLLLLLILFGNSENMIKRLTNVIQMEATYNQLNTTGSSTFNLDKSYTYLRVSGKFKTNEFIKISGSGLLNSKERIVYRGY